MQITVKISEVDLQKCDFFLAENKYKKNNKSFHETYICHL